MEAPQPYAPVPKKIKIADGGADMDVGAPSRVEHVSGALTSTDEIGSRVDSAGASADEGEKAPATSDQASRQQDGAAGLGGGDGKEAEAAAPPAACTKNEEPVAAEAVALSSTVETLQQSRYKKRKVALFIAYKGYGFQGMQRNPGAKTIEGALEKALFRAGAIEEDDLGDWWGIQWARAARTDKGVSALGQVVSAKLMLGSTEESLLRCASGASAPSAGDGPNCERFVDRVNSHLPKQIRLLGYVRVTPSFNAKDMCDRRRYEYFVPTFVFDPDAHRDRESAETSPIPPSRSLEGGGRSSTSDLGSSKSQTPSPGGGSAVAAGGGGDGGGEKAGGGEGDGEVTGGGEGGGRRDGGGNAGEGGGVDEKQSPKGSTANEKLAPAGDATSPCPVRAATAETAPVAVAAGGKRHPDVGESALEGLQAAAGTSGAGGETKTVCGVTVVRQEQPAMQHGETSRTTPPPDPKEQGQDSADVAAPGVSPGKGAPKAPFAFGPEHMVRLNELLAQFKGTHCHHNYAAGVKPEDSAAKRFIVSFEAVEVVEVEGMPLVRCVVVGQSFLLHQIRKMVGMVIAIMRGHAPPSLLATAFRMDRRINVPVAPELGLFLAESMFPRYNSKWGRTHGEVSLHRWQTAVDQFRHEVILPHIVHTERLEHTFANWLSNLNDRNFKEFALARAQLL